MTSGRTDSRRRPSGGCVRAGVDRARLAVAVAVSVIGLTACASSAPGGSPFAQERDVRIRLHVTNLNFADARLYAHRSSQRIPLGSVQGKGERTFTLDWPMSLPLRVEIDLLAGGRCVTNQLSVDPGDVIELQISSAGLRGLCE